MVQSTTAQLVSRAAATTRSLVSRHSDAIVKRLEDLGMNDKKDLYVLLIEGVRRRQELLLSYNIGIPVDIREKEMNKRAAKLVGLELPPGPKDQVGRKELQEKTHNNGD